MTNLKSILITGASSGIGEATARVFAANGWRVSMAARRIDRLDEIKKEIEAAGGQAAVHGPDDVGIQPVFTCCKFH